MSAEWLDKFMGYVESSTPEELNGANQLACQWFMHCKFTQTELKQAEAAIAERRTESNNQPRPVPPQRVQKVLFGEV